MGKDGKVEEINENELEQNQETTQAEVEETTAEEEVKQELSPLAKAEAESAEWKDKYLRIYAEFDNFRKRNAKERIELIKSASSEVLKDIIPVLDDFDRAIQANETNEDIAAVKEGFELIRNKTFRVLEAKGLKAMDAVGKPFDVENHEAITNIPAPSEDMKSKVVDVIEKGYFLNDKVLRFAKVVVGQ
ncbi:MAG: nucleotide exchange factor GrpE [Flavobacteriales bacterium]